MVTPSDTRPGLRPEGRSPRRRSRLPAAALVIALLGAVLAGAGWLVRARSGEDPAATVAAPPATPTSAGPLPSGSAAADLPVTNSPQPSGTATGPGARATPGPRHAPTLAPMPPAQAVARLSGAGIATAGTPTRAWRWTDTNGDNLLLVTEQPTSHYPDGGGVNRITRRVVHAARLDSAPTVLRRLTDAGAAACQTDFGSGLTPDSVTLTDADSDGVAEVTIGWWERCRGDIGPSTVRLGLLSGGDWFVLRGEGFVGDRPPRRDGSFPTSSFTATPAAPAWPAGTYHPTVTLFHRLYP